MLNKLTPYKIGIILALVFIAGSIPLSVYYYWFYTEWIEFHASNTLKQDFILLSVLAISLFIQGGVTMYFLAFGRSKFRRHMEALSSKEKEVSPPEKVKEAESSSKPIEEVIAKIQEKLKLNTSPTTQDLVFAILNEVEACLATYFHYENKTLTPVFTYGQQLDKKKLTTYEIGEGLPGQAAKSKEVVTLSSIPKNYNEIFSGLGSETPTYLWCYPIRRNNKLYGVIEVAAFAPFDDYKKELIDKCINDLWQKVETKDF